MGILAKDERLPADAALVITGGGGSRDDHPARLDIVSLSEEGQFALL